MLEFLPSKLLQEQKKNIALIRASTGVTFEFISLI
jgi:hypothetical protein